MEWIRETKKETRKIGNQRRKNVKKENQRKRKGEIRNVKTGSIVKKRWKGKEEKRGVWMLKRLNKTLQFNFHFIQIVY